LRKSIITAKRAKTAKVRKGFSLALPGGSFAVFAVEIAFATSTS